MTKMIPTTKASAISFLLVCVALSIPTASTAAPVQSIGSISVIDGAITGQFTGDGVATGCAPCPQLPLVCLLDSGLDTFALDWRLLEKRPFEAAQMRAYEFGLRAVGADGPPLESTYLATVDHPGEWSGTSATRPQLPLAAFAADTPYQVTMTARLWEDPNAPPASSWESEARIVVKSLDCKMGEPIKVTVNGGAWFANAAEGCKGSIQIDRSADSSTRDVWVSGRAGSSGSAFGGLVKVDASASFDVRSHIAGDWSGVRGYAWSYSCTTELRISGHGTGGVNRLIDSNLVGPSGAEAAMESCRYDGVTKFSCFTASDPGRPPMRPGFSGHGYENVRDGNSVGGPDQLKFTLAPGYSTKIYNRPAGIGYPLQTYTAIGLDIPLTVAIDWTITDVHVECETLPSLPKVLPC